MNHIKVLLFVDIRNRFGLTMMHIVNMRQFQSITSKFRGRHAHRKARVLRKNGRSIDLQMLSLETAILKTRDNSTPINRILLLSTGVVPYQGKKFGELTQKIKMEDLLWQKMKKNIA